ncbi:MULTISPECIES: hypothetical protein [unclassified Roseateles]|uniref:hypothetical protein n=1 Tax=Pelomonas sp. Root1237 TaxID=1736434 RepID=UPI0006F952C0|nr:hypothetical protein [Pelomonas sp. Root1237]KQV86492.1 hypothetical protein ASC91_21905 [Pelomonas sp. Root1237]
MSNRYSIAQRTPLLNSLFAGVACAVALTLTAGPALAAPGDLERVEVSGRVVEAPVRYDIHDACASLDRQLQDALQTTWENERRVGQVKVQIVIDGGEVTAVRTDGISNRIERTVRNAANMLECGPQKTAGAQIYRFRVDFIDPDDRNNQQVAGAGRGYRIAMVNE